MSEPLEFSDVLVAVATEFSVPTEWFDGLLCEQAESTATRGSGYEHPDFASRRMAAGVDLRVRDLEVENLVHPGEFPDPDSRRRAGGALHAFSGAACSAPTVLRLLFLGAQDTAVRTVGFPPKLLTPSEYVLGPGEGWPGLIAPAKDSRSRSAKARIKLDLDDGGRRIAIERVWDAQASGPSEHLYVDDGVRLLEGTAASASLGRLIAPELVPLFIFEACDALGALHSPQRLRSDIERLHPRSFFDALRREVYRRSGRSAVGFDGTRPHGPTAAEHHMLRIRMWKDKARQRHDKSSQRIRALMGVLHEAHHELACVIGLAKELQDSTATPSDHDQPPTTGISDRTPAGELRLDAALPCAPEGTKSWGRGSELELRSADLRSEIEHLERRLECERAEATKWSDVVVARHRELSTYAEKLAPYAQEQPASGIDSESDRLAQRVADLEEELRRRRVDAIRAALERRADLLEVSIHAALGEAVGEVLNLRTATTRTSASTGMRRRSSDIRAALALRLALLDTSDQRIPMVVGLEAGYLSRSDRAWIDTTLRSQLPSGSILLSNFGKGSDRNG